MPNVKGATNVYVQIRDDLAADLDLLCRTLDISKRQLVEGTIAALSGADHPYARLAREAWANLRAIRIRKD